MMASAEGHRPFALGKRRFEDTNTPTQDICKRFKTVLSTDEDTLIANYILLLEKVNKLESSNVSLEEKVNKLRNDTAALEDKYKEQNLILKKYDKSAEVYKLASDSKELIIKMELLTDKCKAILAENEVLKTDIKYLEKACDKSADYYRTCFT
jgi:uncharacterized protein YfcZ (UPF0381/DUF406 family)